MSRITNISDGNNIEISIYFNPITLHDANITDIIQAEIMEKMGSFWRVIPNNSSPSQFAGIISTIALNMNEDKLNPKNNLCADSIDISNTEVTMSNAQVIITINSKTTAQDLYGFAVVNFTDDGNTMYLEILCSNKQKVTGGGSLLIKILDKMCNILMINHIKLLCINQQALEFYTKVNIGFVPDYEPSFGMCRMTKYLRPIRTYEEQEATTAKLLADADDVEYGGTNKRRKIRRQTNKRRKPRRRSNKRLTNKRNTTRIK
jgi:hypothetical protein